MEDTGPKRGDSTLPRGRVPKFVSLGFSAGGARLGPPSARHRSSLGRVGSPGIDNARRSTAVPRRHPDDRVRAPRLPTRRCVSRLARLLHAPVARVGLVFVVVVVAVAVANPRAPNFSLPVDDSFARSRRANVVVECSRLA